LNDGWQPPELTRAEAFSGPEPRSALCLPPWAAGAWALVAIGVTFVEAIYRLASRALLTLERGLSTAETCALVVSVALFAYGEGYRALHRRFIPQLIVRASRLHPPDSGCLRVWLLGPLIVLSLIQAERSVQLRAWASIGLIVLAVLIVRALPEPWRGIVDAGVAVALAIGLGSLLVRLGSWVRAGGRALD
jgi:hypothetical protein